jgi:hypothetical protein
MFVHFDPSLLYELIDSLLVLMNAEVNSNNFSVDEILSNHDGLIKSKFCHNPKMVEYAMNYICTRDDSTGRYSLN